MIFCPGRSARRDYCRAQNDDRPDCKTERQPAGHFAGDQPEQCLLAAPPGIGRQSETDAPDRQAAYGIPFRGQPDVAGANYTGRLFCGSATRRHADEADGGRGAISQAKHIEAGAGAQDIPLLAAKPAGNPAQPGLGDGHHLYSHGAWLHLPCRRVGLVHASGAVVAGVDHAGARLFA